VFTPLNLGFECFFTSFQINLSGSQGLQERLRVEGTDVVLSPDGKLLVTASDDKTARVWQVGDIDNMLAISSEWVRHYLESNPNVDESDKHLCDDVPEAVTKDKSS